jgi:hypothetical protein
MTTVPSSDVASGQALHAYALYWVIGFSSYVLYLLILQCTYVG